MLLLAALAAAHSLDQSLVDRVVRHHVAALRHCYERRLPSRPTLAGRVVIRFTLERDGTIRSAEAVDSTLEDPQVERCLVEDFLTWDWPPGHSIRVIRYPLVFTLAPPRPGLQPSK